MSENRELSKDEYKKLITVANKQGKAKISMIIQTICATGNRVGETITLSILPKTWIFDIDGTLLKHNGYKIDGHDTLLDGVKEYIAGIPEQDYILLLTSRTEEFRDMTISFLRDNGIRYDQILFNIPMGERIVVNDRKPSGIEMAFVVNSDRDRPDLPVIKREL